MPILSCRLHVLTSKLHVLTRKLHVQYQVCQVCFCSNPPVNMYLRKERAYVLIHAAR